MDEIKKHIKITSEARSIALKKNLILFLIMLVMPSFSTMALMTIFRYYELSNYTLVVTICSCLLFGISILSTIVGFKYNYYRKYCYSYLEYLETKFQENPTRCPKCKSSIHSVNCTRSYQAHTADLIKTVDGKVVSTTPIYKTKTYQDTFYECNNENCGLKFYDALPKWSNLPYNIKGAKMLILGQPNKSIKKMKNLTKSTSPMAILYFLFTVTILIYSFTLFKNMDNKYTKYFGEKNIEISVGQEVINNITDVGSNDYSVVSTKMATGYFSYLFAGNAHETFKKDGDNFYAAILYGGAVGSTNLVEFYYVDDNLYRKQEGESYKEYYLTQYVEGSEEFKAVMEIVKRFEYTNASQASYLKAGFADTSNDLRAAKNKDTYYFQIFDKDTYVATNFIVENNNLISTNTKYGNYYYHNNFTYEDNTIVLPDFEIQE